MTLQIALFEPEIPPNTGNIIRLCANSGARLHLIQPLGFELSDKHLKRAGLDYHQWATIELHANIDSFLNKIGSSRLFACSTKGKAIYTEHRYQIDDIFLLGPESRGLPESILARFLPDHILRIPMLTEARSLNLSNAAAIILYEAWRQLGFKD